MTETFEHAGCTIRVGVEEDASFGDPREGDNPSLLYCWHPSYELGDEQFGQGDHDSMRDVERYLREERGAVGPILPLFLYDHSGLSLSAGSPSPFDNPLVREGEYGPLGWDTTMVGFACAPHGRWTACMGDGEPTDDEVEKVLRQEVRIYDAYLKGQVYWWSVEDADGDVVDSCGGYLTVDQDDYDGMLKEAKESAEHAARSHAAEQEPDLELAIKEVTR